MEGVLTSISVLAAALARVKNYVVLIVYAPIRVDATIFGHAVFVSDALDAMTHAMTTARTGVSSHAARRVSVQMRVDVTNVGHAIFVKGVSRIIVNHVNRTHQNVLSLVARPVTLNAEKPTVQIHGIAISVTNVIPAVRGQNATETPLAVNYAVKIAAVMNAGTK